MRQPWWKKKAINEDVWRSRWCQNSNVAGSNDDWLVTSIWHVGEEEERRKDEDKPLIKAKNRNNVLTLTGFALSYLIITVVPGEFSLGCWPWGGARTIDILTKDRNMLSQCTCRDTLITLSAESQLERKKAVEVQEAWIKKRNVMKCCKGKTSSMTDPPQPPLHLSHNLQSQLTHKHQDFKRHTQALSLLPITSTCLSTSLWPCHPPLPPPLDSLLPHHLSATTLQPLHLFSPLISFYACSLQVSSLLMSR